MTPKKAPTPEQASKAAAAYAEIVAAGERVTVRALATRAGIATEAARLWREENVAASSVDDVPVPDELVTAAGQAVASLVWPAAWAAAREAVSDDDAAEVAALRESEAEAAAEVERLRAELDERDAEIEQLRVERDGATTETANLRRDLELAREARVRAETTADVLQAVVVGFQNTARGAGTDGNSATG